MNNARNQGLCSDSNFLNLVALLANWNVNSSSMRKYIKFSTKAQIRTDGIIYGEAHNYIMENSPFHATLNYGNLKIADLHHNYWCSFMDLLKLLMKTDASYSATELRSYNFKLYYRIAIFFRDFYNLKKISNPNKVKEYLRNNYGFSSSYDFKYWTILWQIHRVYIQLSKIQPIHLQIEDTLDNNQGTLNNMSHKVQVYVKEYMGKMLQYLDNISLSDTSILVRGRRISMSTDDQVFITSLFHYFIISLFHYFII